MRFTVVGLAVLALVVVLSLSLAAAGSMVLFNDTDQEVYGLRVVFDQPVTITWMSDTFETWTIGSSDSMIVFSDGSVAVWSDFWFSWEPSEAVCLSSEWIAEAPRMPFAQPPFPYWGFTLQALDPHTGFDDPELYQSLDRLIGTGANAVLFSPQVYMPDSRSHLVEPVNSRSSHLLSDIAEAIEYLVSAGLAVELKPSILSRDGVWPAKLAPANPEKWFQNYAEVLLAYAEMAEETGVTAFYLTNELRSMVVNPDYTDYWYDIIARIREVYSGALSVNAIIGSAEGEPMGEREVMSIPFADELDFIGVSLYLPLTNRYDPPVEQLERAWYGNCDGENIVEALKTVHELYGKPVMISEVGYRSLDGANAKPWDLSSVGALDYKEQADLFEALMRVLTREGSSMGGDWLRGVSIWAWFPCLRPATRLPMRTRFPLFGEQGSVVQRKPSEALLTHWFHRLGGEPPPDLEYPELTLEEHDPFVVYDASHSPGLAVDQQAAAAINHEHPERVLMEGLVDHIDAVHTANRFSASSLSNCGVLVIAAPSRALNLQEMAAIEEFVSDGGGLLLIGNGGAPDIAFNEFDVSFTGQPIGEVACLWDFTAFEIDELVEHPVTDRCASLVVAWAATMDVGTGWLVLAETSFRAWQEQTGDEEPSAGEKRGPFPVLAVREHGEGRVAAICDNYMFSGAGHFIESLLRWLANDVR